MNAVLENEFIPDSFEPIRNQLILSLFYQTALNESC
jgi:hypothetical protein